MALTRVEVYRRLPSEGATALVDALRGLGVEASRRRRYGAAVLSNTLVICWGQSGEGLQGGKVLNGKRLGDKLEELKLLAKGLPENSVQFAEGSGWGAGLRESETWFGRNSYHQSAYDLRETPTGAREPDFYVRKLNISCEYRVHVFADKAIRIGKKQPDADAPNRHAWIRSLETGWIINYGKTWRGADEERLPMLRKLARTAVKAVGYDFGAVDLGIENGTGRGVVFEVNQAPALLNVNTAGAYAKAIKKELG